LNDIVVLLNKPIKVFSRHYYYNCDEGNETEREREREREGGRERK